MAGLTAPIPSPLLTEKLQLPRGMQEFISDSSSLEQLSLISSVPSVVLFLRTPMGTKIRLEDKNKNTPSPQNLTFLLSNKHTTTQGKGGTSPHLSREWG